MKIVVRPATAADTAAICAVLQEAAQWLTARGITMWRDDELLPAKIGADVAAGLFFVALREDAILGTVKFQLEDPLFWPDVPAGEAAYIHRLAVTRQQAGAGVSTTLMQWAASRTRALGRHYLRLDCEASRPKLRAIYEQFGFRHHSDRQVGPYFVARYEILIHTARVH